MKKLELSGRNGKGRFVLVDDEDYDSLCQFKWCLTNGYPAHGIWESATQKTVIEYLHRKILDVPKGMYADHVDRDVLNAQKSNLRIVTNRQNGMNIRKRDNTSSQYKGVTWDKSRNKWLSRFSYNQKPFFIGRFDKEHHAAMAYDIWAKDHYGEYANLNF